ncbi:HesA/MoeB/ThiF family protein [Ahrensia kielensis]|uniref:HesA/MoeB/ThiF family protein n=1 Tax=Ahrensia kielensis TaxID=76980 RepID=A0ABU9T6C0_9HYPH
MSRYARQEILPEVGTQGQAAIGKATVLIVGVGGLGCPVAQYLAAAGVGRLILVDSDIVSISNLHRQTLFREADIGMLKAQIAAQSLAGLNSDCTIMPVCERLTPKNAKALISEASLVVDCADSFAVSYILSDFCKATATPFITASALGFSGYVGGFCGSAPSLRAVFPDLPARAATCATAGVMGPVVGLLGAAQAQMALSVLVGLEPSPLGQLVTHDLRTMRSSGFRFDNAPEPESGSFAFIADDEIQPSDWVIELRDEAEAPALVHPAARRMKVSDFPTAKPMPDTGQRAVLICRSGLRSWQAATHLKTYWDGPISLIAMGDMPELERP